MYESANVDFNDIFSLRKPKDAKAGIASGLKSMAKGCLAGVIGVFAGPAIGACKAGMKGFCCGMLAGCVGACVLPSTGFAVGTVQICRGLINTPEAVMESLRGKVWDEVRPVTPPLSPASPFLCLGSQRPQLWNDGWHTGAPGVGGLALAGCLWGEERRAFGV